MKTIVLRMGSDNLWLAESLALAFPSVGAVVDGRKVTCRCYGISPAEIEGIKRWVLAEEYREDSALALREAAEAKRAGQTRIA